MVAPPMQHNTMSRPNLHPYLPETIDDLCLSSYHVIMWTTVYDLVTKIYTSTKDGYTLRPRYQTNQFYTTTNTVGEAATSILKGLFRQGQRFYIDDTYIFITGSGTHHGKFGERVRDYKLNDPHYRIALVFYTPFFRESKQPLSSGGDALRLCAELGFDSVQLKIADVMFEYM